jgi:hypothetical protein
MFGELQNDLQLCGSKFDSVVMLTNIFIEKAGAKRVKNEPFPILHVPELGRRLLRIVEWLPSGNSPARIS